MLEKHRKTFGENCLKEVTADSGYCSEKNLLYLKENRITSYIKLQDHEKRKTRAYKEDIGKYYNMRYEVFEDEPYYICHDGRELRHIRTETKEQNGYTQTLEVYGCADCSGCEHKADVCTNIMHRQTLKDPEPADPINPDGRALWGYQGKRKIPTFSLSFRRKSI